MLIFPAPVILSLLSKLPLRIVLLVILHYCVQQLREFVLHLCLPVD